MKFWPNLKRSKSLKPNKLHPPNSVHMHISLTSTCINFVSQFNFWPHSPKGYSFGKFEAKKEQNSKTREDRPTKLGAQLDIFVS